MYILSFLNQPLPLLVTEGPFQSYSYSTQKKTTGVCVPCTTLHDVVDVISLTWLQGAQMA